MCEPGAFQVHGTMSRSRKVENIRMHSLQKNNATKCVGGHWTNE